jgi:hypothetical protein
MNYEELFSRVSVETNICGGKPCIQGTRIYIAIIRPWSPMTSGRRWLTLLSCPERTCGR